MKILCLGNGDNLGIRVYTWLKDVNQNVKLHRIVADEDVKRGNPYLYLDQQNVDNDPNINLITDDLFKIRILSLFGGKKIDEINRDFDFVIITGGWHALIYSRMIKKPKLFIYVGYELHTMANNFRGLPSVNELKTSFKSTLRNYFYAWLTRNSFKRVNKYLDWFAPVVAITKSLGLSNKIIYMSVGEDVLKNKNRVNKSLKIRLDQNSKHCKKTFLFLSRLNFLDTSKANCKWAHLFLAGLETQQENIEKGLIKIYIGYHGQDAEQYKIMAKKSCIYQYITWVDHLDYPDLMSYLSIDNGVLFTDFGAINSGISGIGRDGYTMGTPMVNSTTDEIMVQQFTKPGPRIYAITQEDVNQAMSKIINMDDNEFNQWKLDTEIYGQNYVDKSFFIKRLLNEINYIAT